MNHGRFLAFRYLTAICSITLPIMACAKGLLAFIFEGSQRRSAEPKKHLPLLEKEGRAMHIPAAFPSLETGFERGIKSIESTKKYCFWNVFENDTVKRILGRFQPLRLQK